MNRERAKELLPIIQAYAEGKDVQIKLDNGWMTLKSTSFYDDSEYRIKPEPREYYIYCNASDEPFDVSDHPTIESLE